MSQFVTPGAKNTNAAKHGHRRGDNWSGTYNSWRSMKQRCNNKLHKSYWDYGGKGITYDPLWENFMNFLLDMGIRPTGYDLDRKDSSGSYNEDNCRWIPMAKNRGRRF